MQASAIEGQGLFAIKRIPRGEIVSRLGGQVVTTAGLHRLIDESAHYVDTITVGDDQHLVLPPGTPNGKGNHSCDPNLAGLPMQGAGWVIYSAGMLGWLVAGLLARRR